MFIILQHHNKKVVKTLIRVLQQQNKISCTSYISNFITMFDPSNLVISHKCSKDITRIEFHKTL
jgi:hypothetical protein